MVEAVDGLISKGITGEPGSVLFVVSTYPAIKANVQEPGRAKFGSFCAFMGQVPVCVVPGVLCAPNAFLVPSGANDGCARPVTSDELIANPGLKEQVTPTFVQQPLLPSTPSYTLPRLFTWASFVSPIRLLAWRGPDKTLRRILCTLS